MVVQHNLLSNFTQRELKISTGQKTKSTEKLSSGYRINRSADDAAGLSISEKMRWNIRGLDKASKNCQDGCSMMQVADGALTEVHAMLDRMKELSVQAANDTNTPEDRQAIQKEMNQLVQEIDRIGDTTEFNTMPLFKGSEMDVIDQNTGQRINASDIPISDFSIADVDLIGEPFSYSSDKYREAKELNLGVVLKGNYNVSGTVYPLIYNGSFAGSTSNTRFHFWGYNGDNKKVIESVDLTDMSVIGISQSGNTFTRTFLYESEKNKGLMFQIDQNVTIGSNDGTSQGYSISYDIKNMSSTEYTGGKCAVVMNVDTSYGGTHQGDYDEAYFSNGAKIDRYNVYAKPVAFHYSAQLLEDGQLTIWDYQHQNGFDSSLKSFSIYNQKNPELPFTEYVNVNNATLLAFGEYGTGADTLEGIAKRGGKIGSSTENGDKTFTAMWCHLCETGENIHIDAMELGIKKKTADSNLAGLDVSGKTGRLHSEKWDLWIQSGATEKSGFFVSIGEMNSTILGVKGLDVSSYAAASNANASIDKAITSISAQRTLIGVQQNRLETATKIDDSTSENTQYAESRIRDTDMAKEMVNYSKHNIVEQVGQSMLTQANQSTQGIMTLLS